MTIGRGAALARPMPAGACQCACVQCRLGAHGMDVAHVERPYQERGVEPRPYGPERFARKKRGGGSLFQCTPSTTTAHPLPGA